MLNHIVVMGRLTRDPELRRTGSGIAVTSFTVAVDRDFSNKESGERETDFIDCVAWRSTGEFVSKYFTKGSMAVVSGRLQIRIWTDKDGNKQYSDTFHAITKSARTAVNQAVLNAYDLKLQQVQQTDIEVENTPDEEMSEPEDEPEPVMSM